jgi:capsular exopolysaccharide synthesis family protein
VATVHTSAASAPTVKTPGDYLRAVRRRIWLILALAIPMGTAGTLYVLRMPAIYQVTARIEVKQPKVDPSIDQMLSHSSDRSEASDEKYVANAIALLTSKNLIKEILRDPALGLSASALEGDAAGDLIAAIKPKPIPGSYQYLVTLEGRDPDQITKTLNFLLKKFKDRIGDKSRSAADGAKESASITLTKQSDELKKIQQDLETHLLSTESLTPGGRNLSEAKYDALTQQLYFRQQRAMTIGTEAQMAGSRPMPEVSINPAKAQKIANLEEKRKKEEDKLMAAKRIARSKSDPAIVRTLMTIEKIDEDIAELSRGSGGAEAASPTEVYREIIAEELDGIKQTEVKLGDTLEEMKRHMPNIHKYNTLMEERANKTKQINELKQRIAEFDLLSKSRNEPVEIIDEAFEPIVPVKPNRFIFITVCLVFSIGLGVGLVCFLEHIDHSVKVPEHLTAGLGLPLFGVVPRMLRNARNHRGGHLWTPGTPESIEADAYRNLRASLLGFTTESNPIVTLLVTSAKAGEGKSTTALNLAATCARAGERTLLMDVDLRRPSLNDVFPGNENGTGLVDILRGDLPWQRTVVQTDLPNLDFLPTGDPRDVPIEVLGSLELRQLLISLSEHHYDRVILDGPAVLGLADCRMLGRIVDGAVLVVRSGSQELRPLQRAKAMLEQSQVRIVGLIFNGLIEDLQNWSSYGPNPMLEASMDLTGGRSGGSSRGLDAPQSQAGSLMAVGSVES